MRAGSKLAWAVALACACQEPDDLAQTIVWVDAEPAARGAIASVVIRADSSPNDPRMTEGEGWDWPIKLVLAPKRGDASRPITLHIEAYDAARTRLMTVRFTSGFVAQQARYVKLLLHSACVTQPSAGCSTDACNVWDLEPLAASSLSRDPREPRRLDVECSSTAASMPPEDAGGAAGTTGGTSQPAAAGTGAGTTDGSSPPPTNGMCRRGYASTPNGCADINDCEGANPCGDHGQCENTPGDYKCMCQPGYQPKDGTCVDECQTQNGGCEGTCKSSSGGVACACADNEWLKADRKLCGGFGTRRPLSLRPSRTPMEPRFAFDGDGNGLAVWRQSDGTTESLWTRRYVAREGWAGIASQLSIPTAGSVDSPLVALDSGGRGIVVWRLTVGPDSDIWAARYADQRFDEPKRIGAGEAGTVLDPSLELDIHGDGFAAWTRSHESRWQIWTNRFSAARGWAGARSVASTSGEQAFGAALALDSAGNASLTWTQVRYVDAQDFQVSPWATRLDPARGEWRSPVQLDDRGLAGFADNQLFGPDARGLAVWPRLLAGRVSIQAREYSPDITGWNPSVYEIGPAGSDTLGALLRGGTLPSAGVLPRVAVSSTGSGAAIWAHREMSRVQVWANLYKGTGAPPHWTDATPLSDALDSTASVLPQLAVDPSGNGFAVWSEIRGTARTIRAARLQSDVGFLEDVMVTMDDTAAPPANSPVRIAVDSRGDAIVIWDVFEAGQYFVWATTFE